MHSAIYKGVLQHCRYAPKHHFFQYSVFMVYLDLSELDSVFNLSHAWSCRLPALAWLRRKDFIGDPKLSIDEAVRAKIKQECGETFNGAIRMLANLRYFGFQMNPIVCYYCFDDNECLRYVVAEVTNTPWREKHAYVLTCDPNTDVQQIRFNKELHVSPFNDMNFTYEWIGAAPQNELTIRLINWRGEEKLFDANLKLNREAISARTLTGVLCLYPLMTLKVFAAIYWQALKLLLKKVPFIGHPGTITSTSLTKPKINH